DLRRIDWKATARSRNLTVREFTAEDERRVVIFFDTHIQVDTGEMSLREKIEAEQSGNGSERPERFEHGVSLAASVLAYFSEQEAEIRLVIDEDVGEPGFGTRHLYECLKRLSGVEAKTLRDETTPPPWQLPESAESGLEESHNFLITSLDYDVSSDWSDKLNFIRF
ncbi:MAG: DUF58 domain-containing protein, partial [Acidobacteriota bacterium]